MKEKEIEKIKELRGAFSKCVNILDEILVLDEKLSSTNDKDEKEKIEKEADEKLDLFMVQMIKISKLSN